MVLRGNDVANVDTCPEAVVRFLAKDVFQEGIATRFVGRGGGGGSDSSGTSARSSTSDRIVVVRIFSLFTSGGSVHIVHESPHHIAHPQVRPSNASWIPPLFGAPHAKHRLPWHFQHSTMWHPSPR